MSPIGTDLDITGMGITTVRGITDMVGITDRITHTPDTGLTTAHITDMDTGITTVHIVDTTNTEDTVEAQGEFPDTFSRWFEVEDAVEVKIQTKSGGCESLATP